MTTRSGLAPIKTGWDIGKKDEQLEVDSLTALPLTDELKLD